MQGRGGDPAVGELHRLFEAGPLGGMTDGELLARFVARREAAVFEGIVRRHGPMVWGVCRRVLRDHHRAEDAFQATFLVLARRAAAVQPPDRVGPWLHGVARRTALKSRGIEARRRLREAQIPGRPEAEVARDPDDLLLHLDREVGRLPEKYRAPVVLCELEGKTYQEAAALLGWPVGTVAGRLSRARQLLAARRRVSPGGVLMAGLGQRFVVPADLIGLAGRAVVAGASPADVVALVEGVVRTMFWSKIKLAAAVTLMSLGVVAGGAGLAYRATAADPSTPQASAPTARTQAPPAQKRSSDVAAVQPATGQDKASKPPFEMNGALIKPDKPFDPTASHRFTVDPDHVYELPSIQVDTKGNFRLAGGPVVSTLIMVDGRPTGAMLLGKLSFEYTPEAGKVFRGAAGAAMLRFNWQSPPPGLSEAFGKASSHNGPQGVVDKGMAEVARHLLAVTIRRCYQRNYVQNGARQQEVLIPPPGALAVVMFSQEHGEILVSDDGRTAIVHGFTEGKTLYERK